MKSARPTDLLIAEKLKQKNLTMEVGMPPHEFYTDAWGDEPLTSKALVGTDIMYSLASGDPKRTYVMKDEKGAVVGQCAMNDTVQYWDHVNGLDLSKQNKSTTTFVEIHKLAAEEERKHLASLDLDVKDSLHNAGVAVVRNERRKGLGTMLTEHRVVQAYEAQKTTLFAETTNAHSSRIMANLQFFKVASHAYKDLAVELSNTDLEKLDDSFNVWCKQPGK